MTYITLVNNIDDVILRDYTKSFGVVKRLNYFLKTKFGMILNLKVMDKDLLILPKLNKDVLNKLGKIINIKCIKLVCLSQELLGNSEFVEFIKGQSIEILKGKWLFDYLILKSIEHIVQNKKEELESQNISIFTNDITDIMVYNIIELADKVKILNIVTLRPEKFKTLKKKLFNEKEIVLNINNKKELLKSDIVINYDFNEQTVNKYTLSKKCCIINLKNEIKINSKTFEGINIYSYKIEIPNKYLKEYMFLKDFNEEILYESFIYKRTSAKNIVNEINNDGVYISFLEDKNGKIKKSDYAKMSKKTVELT